MFGWFDAVIMNAYWSSITIPFSTSILLSSETKFAKWHPPIWQLARFHRLSLRINFNVMDYKISSILLLSILQFWDHSTAAKKSYSILQFTMNTAVSVTVSNVLLLIMMYSIIMLWFNYWQETHSRIHQFAVNFIYSWQYQRHPKIIE